MPEDLIHQTTSYVAKLPAAVITLVIGAIIIKMIKYMVFRTASLAKVDSTLLSLIGSVITVSGWIMTLAAAMATLGLSQISLALGGSIALVAMSLATGLNSVTQDFMAGIFLISDPDFKVGKKVKTAGLEGHIEHVTIRKTKIRDGSGVLHAVPNRIIDAATYAILEDVKTDGQASA